MPLNDLHHTPGKPQNTSSRDTCDLPSREEVFLTKVEQLILDNLENQQFTVPDLALAMDLSVSQLNRRLNSLNDRSAGQLIREMRLAYAAECLTGNVASIRAIARMVGYKNQAHFCRSFKKQYGCAPSEFSDREGKK